MPVARGMAGPGIEPGPAMASGGDISGKRKQADGAVFRWSPRGAFRSGVLTALVLEGDTKRVIQTREKGKKIKVSFEVHEGAAQPA